MKLRAGFFSLLTLMLITAIIAAGSLESMSEFAVLVTRIFLSYCTLISGSQTVNALSHAAQADKNLFRVKIHRPEVAAETT